ncbi:MAG: hypothetical protein WC788_06265 [Candidatus Paceibacterota bacterium]|jgi:hypothetical protein
MRFKAIVIMAVLIAIFASFSGYASSAIPAEEANKTSDMTAKTFVIQPKIGEVNINTSNPRTLATRDYFGNAIVLEEDKSFVLDFSDSIVPNPPATYLYDNNGDGVTETPFKNGDWALFTMIKTDPLYEVCKKVSNGESCISKISAIDSAGNRAEFVFSSTTIYK